jgi:hypothetical protein
MRHLEPLAAALALVLALVSARADGAEPARLRFDPQFVLAQVAARLGVRLDPAIAPPAVHLESATPLAQFRAAIAAQWGFRPHVFGNAYAVERNEIYLIDEPGYYARLGRSPDESLAHELAHYVQVRYLGADLAEPSWEAEAIAVQAWFSAAHLQPPRATLAP